MSDATPDAFDLMDSYVHLTDGADARRLEVGPDFWATIDQRRDLEEGRLVLLFHAEKDWDTWEMHPAGDEIVMLLSGTADLVLDLPGGERVVPLRGRQAVVVPRGVWHRAIVHAPCDTLHVTRGAGTQHRAV